MRIFIASSHARVHKTVCNVRLKQWWRHAWKVSSFSWPPLFSQAVWRAGYALYLHFTLECPFITPTLCLCHPPPTFRAPPYCLFHHIHSSYTILSLTCTSHSHWQGRPIALSTVTPHKTKFWKEFAQNYSGFSCFIGFNFLQLLKRFIKAR
jgi:hypothetical protein